MKISKFFSDKRIITPFSTEKNISNTKEVFLDQCIVFMTDVDKYELTIILRPKKFSGITLPDSSGLAVEHNHSNELFAIIKHHLAQEKHVEKILFLKENDIFHIWTAISEYHNEDKRKAIYKKEAELMNFLSKADFHFDFFLVEPEDVDDILSTGAVIIYDKLESKI